MTRGKINSKDLSALIRARQVLKDRGWDAYRVLFPGIDALVWLLLGGILLLVCRLFS